MNYHYDDAGRAKSKRSKQTNDCVIRAISLTLKQPYDEVYDGFMALGRKCSRGTPKKVWQQFLNSDKRFVRKPFPAVAGQPRMSLEKFAEIFDSGLYIVQMAGHLTTVINGSVYDVFEPRKDGCVYAVWRLIE